jgi:hypothetical protein
MPTKSIGRLGWCLSAMTVLWLPALAAAGQGLDLPKTEAPKTLPLNAPKTEAPKPESSSPPWTPIAVFGGVVVVLGVVFLAFNRGKAPEATRGRPDWNAMDVGGQVKKSSMASRMSQIGACVGVMVQTAIEGPPGLSGKIDWDQCMRAGLYAMAGGTVFFIIGMVIDATQRRSE